MCYTQTNYVTMNKIYLYQRGDDGLLFTYDQLDELKKITRNYSEDNYFFEGIEFQHILSEDVTDRILETDGIHIVRTNEFAELFNNTNKMLRKYVNTDVQIIVIGGNLEQHIFSTNGDEEEEMFNLIHNSTNIRMLHNTPTMNMDRIVFEPKIYFYQYLNLQKERSGDGITNFYYYKDIFRKLPKEKRLGIHMGTLGDRMPDRYNLVKRLLLTDYCSHPNLFFTLNTNHTPLTHKRLLSDTNIDIDKYESFNVHDKERKDSLRYNREYYPPNYFIGLANLFINSDIEILYETNGRENSVLYKKPTEKLLKSIILGKPFINMDPIIHHIVKEYGFNTYDNLLGEDLLNEYNRYSVDTFIGNINSVTWVDTLFNRIQQLLDMDVSTYSALLNEANTIAQQNIKRFEEVYHNTALINKIKELGWI